MDLTFMVEDMSSEQGLALLKAALNVGALFGFIVYRFITDGHGHSPLSFQAMPPDVLRSRILAILDDLINFKGSSFPAKSPRKSARSINHLLKLLLNHNPLAQDYSLLDGVDDPQRDDYDEPHQELITAGPWDDMIHEADGFPAVSSTTRRPATYHLERTTVPSTAFPETAAFDRLAAALFEVFPPSLKAIIHLRSHADISDLRADASSLCDVLSAQLQKGQIVATFVTTTSLTYAWAKLSQAHRIATTKAIYEIWLNNGKPCSQHHPPPPSPPPATATSHGVLLVKKHAEKPRLPAEVAVTFDPAAGPASTNNLQKGKVVDSKRGPLIKSIVGSPELHVFPSFFQGLDEFYGRKDFVTRSTTIAMLSSTTSPATITARRETRFSVPLETRTSAYDVSVTAAITSTERADRVSINSAVPTSTIRSADRFMSVTTFKPPFKRPSIKNKSRRPWGF